MEKQATQLEHTTISAANMPTGNIDFHSIMDMKSYDGKSPKLDNVSSVVESPNAAKGGAEPGADKTTAKAAESGRALPEHGLNNLKLTENGHDINPKEHELAKGHESLKAHELAKGHESVKANEPANAAKSSEQAVAHPPVLPNLSIENKKN